MKNQVHMHRKMHKVYGLSSSLETSICALLVAIYFSDSSHLPFDFLSRFSSIVSDVRQNINKKEIGSLSAQHTFQSAFLLRGDLVCSMSWSLSNYDDKKLLVNLCLLRFAFIPAL